MLHIKNIKFLCKIETAMDAFDTPQLVLKISIDDSFFFPDAIGKTSKNQTVWEELPFPPVQLSPNQSEYLVTFIMYRNGLLIGTAKTTIQYGKSVKEQNQIMHTSNISNGLIAYEGEWISNTHGGTYVTWETFKNFKQSNLKTGNQAVPTATTTSHKKRQYHRQNSDDEGCGGICSCFNVRKKPQKRPVRNQPQQEAHFSNEMKTNYYSPNEVKHSGPKKQLNRKPFVYTQKQLGEQITRNGENPHKNEPLRKLTYYSKTYHKS